MIPTGWIKLWTDLLDDPKMLALNDHLWRRTVELFLVAGENGRTGNLPDLPFMAWRLRIPMADLEADLTEIEKTGIVAKGKKGWHVPHFPEWQGPLTAAERQRRLRQRRAPFPDEELAGVTVVVDRNENVTQNLLAPSLKDLKNLDLKNLDLKDLSLKRKGKVIPPSVKVFRDVMHRFPNKCLFGEIEKEVGEDPKELERWRTHLLYWVKRGYNPTNLLGILDAFKGVPQQKPKSDFDLELEALKRG